MTSEPFTTCLWDRLTADGGQPGPCGWLKPLLEEMIDVAAGKVEAAQ
jgi:hypothetical protein